MQLEYCNVQVKFVGWTGTKVEIFVDYGQERKIQLFQDDRLKDEKGQILKFNSPIDALNYMASYDWEVVTGFPFSDSKNQAIQYLMKRVKKG